uniref:Uncharacterized protein n=1 Tax=Arundo donax TaxID=35708 RepID=A0A0A9C8C9_ARUDO
MQAHKVNVERLQFQYMHRLHLVTKKGYILGSIAYGTHVRDTLCLSNLFHFIS